MSFYEQVIRLVVEPPGNFAYHFLTILALQAALFIAFGQWRLTRESPAGRLAAASGLALLARLTLLVVALLVQFGIVASAAILPPLDRAVSAATLLALGWVLIFPSDARPALFLLVDLLIVTGIGYILSAIQWFPAGDAGEPYNTSLPETLWEVAQISLLVAGLAALALRRRGEWGVALGVLVALLVGHLVQLISPDPARSFPGAVRLAELAALPLVAVVAYRQAVGAAFARTSAPAVAQIVPVEAAVAAPPPVAPFPAPADVTVPAISVAQVAAGMTQPPVEASPAATLPDQPVRPAARPRTALASNAAPALAAIGGASDFSEACERIATGVGRLMLADLTLLIQPPDAAGMAQVQCVFDLIREQQIAGFAISLSEMPTLRAALSADRPRAARLAPSAHASELARLAVRIGTPSVGPGIVVPVVADSRLQAAVLVLSPYSGREWNADDQAVLESLAPALAPVLLAAGQKAAADKRMGELTEHLESARAEVQASRERADRLASALHTVEAQLERETSRANSVSAQLQMESEAGAALEAALAERARLEGELHMALTELAELTSRAGHLTSERDALVAELKRSQAGAAELAARAEQIEAASAPAASGQRAGAEVIAAISQELRQPMSSITGYTDLLLAESVGIIGALQRKFLERVKASTERMGSLLDDLIRLTAIDSGTLELEPEAVDVGMVIDEAITACSAQFRDKEITLRLDLEDELPALKADHDALQQIVSHLLTNACLASSANGEVVLSAGAKASNGSRQFLLSVRDTGGGIPPEDQGRVFTRFYRADNPLIPGLGETGVGLSIAKVLVEAQGGSIWVESDEGVGSTFYVSLPVNGAGNAAA